MDSSNDLTKVVFKSLKKQYDSIDAQECADSVRSVIDNNSSLVYIGLSGNSYSKEFCSSFANLVKSATNLEKLNANDIFVSRLKDDIPFSLEYLTGALIGNTKFIHMKIKAETKKK